MGHNKCPISAVSWLDQALCKDLVPPNASKDFVEWFCALLPSE